MWLQLLVWQCSSEKEKKKCCCILAACHWFFSFPAGGSPPPASCEHRGCMCCCYSRAGKTCAQRTLAVVARAFYITITAKERLRRPCSYMYKEIVCEV